MMLDNGRRQGTVGFLGHPHIKQVLLTIALGTASLNPKLESIPILLIRAGATVNRWILPKPLPGLEIRSMIGLAAYHGLLKTVQAMIAAGADVNLRDGSGRTALFDACLQGHLSVAKELLRAGARIDATDCTGLAPLEAVRQQERSPAMAYTQLRLNAGVNVDKSRLNSERAAWREQRARILALLESRSRKADVTASGESYSPPVPLRPFSSRFPVLLTVS